MADSPQATVDPGHGVVEDSFRRDMVQAITQLNTEMRSVQAVVQDIRLTLKEHATLLGCAAKEPSEQWQQARARIYAHAHAHGHLPAGAARRNHSSTLMSLAEIEADFAENDRRALYAEGGDCELAAAEAWAFFYNTHKLMRPKLVQGVLYARSGQPVMGKTGRPPEATCGITPLMRRYVLRGLQSGACIWEPADDACSHGVMNAFGMKHRVALVRTLEGARVLVDWGVGQFSQLPPDIGLYVLPDNENDM